MLFLGANVIANYWLQIPDAEMTLVALSPAIFFVAISSVMRGYFNGRQNIKATARSQTIEQVFKTALTIILVEIIAVISNVSTEWMAGGATLATTLATMSGFGYLYLYYKTRSKEIAVEIKSTVNYKYERVRTIIRRILVVSIPIALTAIMSSLNKNIDSFTVVRSLKQFMPEDMALSQYGILGGKVDTLTSLPLSINVAFSTALVPAISAAKARKDKKTITEKTSFSLLTSMLIGLPCTIGMCIFASARDLQKRQPLILFAPRDFIDLRGKRFRVLRFLRITLQGREQLVHALHPKRRTKKARKHASAGNQFRNLRIL